MNIRKKLKKLKKIAINTLRLSAAVLLHKVIRVKKPYFLIICGFSRSGSSLAYDLIRQTCPHNVVTFDEEKAARSISSPLLKSIITKRPLDIFDADLIAQRNKATHRVIFLFTIRDPRELITSKHQAVPNDYFQGADYQYFFTDKHTSFCNPGVVPCYKKYTETKNNKSIESLTIRYEDLTTSPQSQLSRIEILVGEKFLSAQEYDPFKAPESLSRAMNGSRPITRTSKPRWTDELELERVLIQNEIFPELHSIAKDLGYPSIEDTLRRNQISSKKEHPIPGIIVAFYTNDELYRTEAERLKISLCKLELNHLISTYDGAGKSWEENCSRKPFLLLETRKKIRGPILYIDVDAVIHKNPWPYLNLYTGDLATNVLRSGELTSGTIFLNDTVGCQNALEKWCQQQALEPGAWDQKTLAKVVHDSEQLDTNFFIFQRLPPNMTYIFDKKYDNIYGDIYIEHLQASRTKKKITGKKLQNRNNRIKEINKMLS